MGVISMVFWFVVICLVGLLNYVWQTVSGWLVSVFGMSMQAALLVTFCVPGVAVILWMIWLADNRERRMGRIQKR